MSAQLLIRPVAAVAAVAAAVAAVESREKPGKLWRLDYGDGLDVTFLTSGIRF